MGLKMRARNWRSKAIISLAKNTTYHCGRLERYVINYLRRVQRKIHVKELIRTLKPFKPTPKDEQELIEACQRLSKRNIIKITRIS